MTTNDTQQNKDIRSAPTNRWDTVFAIRIDDANAVIKQAGSSPKNFKYKSDEKWKINGNFSAWRITTNGSGKLIKLALPIASGEMVDEGGSKHPLTDVTAIVEVQLAFIKSTTQPDHPTKGVNHDLKVKITSERESDKAATVVEINFSDGKEHNILSSYLTVALEGWLNENLFLFDHIFATVNLNRQVDTGQFQWLYPTDVRYAYGDKSTEEDSVLAVLCMTEGRSCFGFVQEVTFNAIPDTARAGFLISKSRFLEKMVHPAMPFAFEGTKFSDYKMSQDENSLTLNDNAYPQFRVEHEGKHYDVQFESLSITAQDNTVIMDAKCKLEVSPGIWAHSHSIHTYEIILKNKSNGKPTLDYQEVGSPTVDHWTTQDKGVTIAEYIALLVGVIVVIVVTVLTSGAAFIVAALIAGLLTGGAVEASHIIAAVGKDDAPDLELLTFNSIDPIVWTGQQKFSLMSAGLNDSLQLGGTYHVMSGE